MPIPLGAYFAVGKSSRRVAEAVTHRGVRFTFTLSFSLSMLWLGVGGALGARIGVVSFLVGMAAGNWSLHSVAGIEYQGEEGSVLPA